MNGPISKEQLYKIQEVLRHPSQYRDRLKPEDRPATGEYAKSFNKLCPKKIEVNEATVEEPIKFSQYLKRSKEDIAQAIGIYKSLEMTHSMDPRKSSWLNLRNNRTNDYPASTTQMHTTAPYKIQHLDKKIALPLHWVRKLVLLSLLHLTITKTIMLFVIQVLVQV